MTVDHWESFKWYTSLEDVVNGLGNLMVRTSEAQTLAEALAEVENVSTLLYTALSPQFEVNPKGELHDC